VKGDLSTALSGAVLLFAGLTISLRCALAWVVHRRGSGRRSEFLSRRRAFRGDAFWQRTVSFGNQGEIKWAVACESHRAPQLECSLPRLGLAVREAA